MFRASWHSVKLKILFKSLKRVVYERGNLRLLNSPKYCESLEVSIQENKHEVKIQDNTFS